MNSIVRGIYNNKFVFDMGFKLALRIEASGVAEGTGTFSIESSGTKMAEIRMGKISFKLTYALTHVHQGMYLMCQKV